MDGFKGRLNWSVQLKLSIVLSLAILAVALVAGVFSFAAAFDDARELQDGTLRQVAALLDRQHLSLAKLGENSVQDGDEETRVIVQALGATGTGALPLPASLPDGMRTMDLGGEPFRVLVKTTASGERIAVAQETGVRDEIARDTALRTLMPFLILVPILLLVVARLVRAMFRPISTLSIEIDQRAEQELHPVQEEHLPSEVRLFVVAINRLLAKVAQSMEAQQRFVADAAHELRSPLTALSLQAERLAHADMSEAARERLIVLRYGIERGRNLLEQLLALARAQAAPDNPKALVSIQHVYRRVLEDLLPLAEAKHIDIGVEGEQDAQVLASELDLVTVVKNLVDNAIRYTPDGGRVDISLVVTADQAILQIKDSGPGIPLQERARVFDPFYRTLGSDQLGSGLGLSIVKAIADRMGAEVLLASADEVTLPGLCASVVLPRG
jgi:two-component system OmpR family sensor kinase